MPTSSERSRWWVPYAILVPALLLALIFAIALLLADGIDSRDDGRQFAAGTPWAGQSITGFGEVSPEDFDDFPIAWAGPDALGYRLQSIQRAAGAVTFTYGICTTGEGRCDPPIVLTARPLCGLPVDLLLTDSPEDNHALLLEPGDGRLFVLTGSSAIQVGGELELDVRRAVPSELVPYGASRTILGPVFDNFPPPDLTACD